MNDKSKGAERLGIDPVKKLIPQFVIPAIMGFVVVSLYNIVDRIFIGQGVGALAISGLALTMPITNMIAAIGTLVGVGASARISIVLGKGDYNWARNILAHVPMLNAILSAIFISVSLFFMDDLLSLFGGSADTIPYAKEYLLIVIPASVFTNICFSLCSVMRGSGAPNKSMYVMSFGVILNILLDPVFIFWLDMGIQGAAIATAISMFAGAIYAVLHFVGKSKPVSFHMENFKIKPYIVRNIVSIGVSPFTVNFAACFVALILNSQLAVYGNKLPIANGGDLAIGAFGIINSYLTFIVMIILGFCQGTQPIIGFNYGKGNNKRVKDTFMISLRVCTYILILGFLIFQFFPLQLASIFVSKDEIDMIHFITRGLHICSLCFPVMAIQLVASQYFMAVSKAKVSILLSVSRQVLLLIPAVLLLPIFFGVDGVWYSLPVSDLIATVIAVYFLYKEKVELYGKSHIRFFRLPARKHKN